MLRGRCLFLFVLLLVTACGGDGKNDAPVPGGIVSLSPAISETLFALGAGERVVGVTRFCNRPQELVDGVHSGKIAAVGDLFNPGIERIIALRPALVLAERTSHVNKLDRLRTMDIHFVDLPLQTMADIRAMIIAVGDLVGNAAAAVEAVARINAAFMEKIDGVMPRVLLVYYSNDPASVSAVGPISYQSEIVVQLGAKNVLAERMVVTPILGPENILALDPDLVLELNPEPRRPTLAERWAPMTTLRALKTGDVRQVEGVEVDSMGPMVEGLIHKLREALLAWQVRHGHARVTHR